MDAMPGTPQIQNIIPTSFFGTTAWAAPVLGLIGSACIMGLGLAYLGWRRRAMRAAGEGYGAPASPAGRSEEHTSELQSLMRISYAVFCLKKKKNQTNRH